MKFLPHMLPTPIITALALALSMPAGAQSLIELHAAARGYDAAFQSAKSNLEAAQAKAAQARAALYPTAGLVMDSSRTNLATRVEGAPKSESTYGTNSATVSGKQPLYNPANAIGATQGSKGVEVAQAQLLAAEQDVIMRVSQGYFDVLASQDSLTFVKAQKTAVAEQLASAKRNFEVGTSTITDTREAQAKYDLVIAQEIAAENDLRIKRLALDQLVGKPDSQPKPLALPVALPALQPANVDEWVQQAQNTHPDIVRAKLGLELARLDTDKARSGHLPTLDLYGSYRLGQNNGSSLSPTDSRSNSATIGLTLNIPLFAGFAVQNRIKETLALEDKASTDLLSAQRAVAQGTRTAYFGVLSGQGQVKALEAAETSSQSALDATKLGYQVGVRINIDVLNAQSALFQTKRDLAKARYDVLLTGLKLRQASGTLKAEDLGPVNALFAP
ncbi:MAG: TolC family outer membrane protein [Rhodoferax sp.]|nr:TolC family outer membrane protein [Rhodoferax sp.]